MTGLPDAPPTALSCTVSPTVAVEAIGAKVMTWATLPIVTVWPPLTASGETPLLAVTVKVKAPALVGVPESTPSLVRLSPAGRVPEDTAYVGVGDPDAAKV